MHGREHCSENVRLCSFVSGKECSNLKNEFISPLVYIVLCRCVTMDRSLLCFDKCFLVVFTKIILCVTLTMYDYVCVYVYVCMCMCVYVCMCMYVCTCVYVCVCNK